MRGHPVKNAFFEEGKRLLGVADLVRLAGLPKLPRVHPTSWTRLQLGKYFFFLVQN